MRYPSMVQLLNTFVPDNLKQLLRSIQKDDLVLQSTFSDLEDFYDTIVSSTAPAHA